VIRRIVKICASVPLLVATMDAMGAALYTHDVYCKTEKCGTMEIDIYAARATATAGGVEIDGQLVPVPGNSTQYHYLQAVVVDDAPLNYRDGTAMAAPYLDPPPGGYENQPWDYLPWYDEGEFPTFYDYPKNPWTDVPIDGAMTVQFETWLVCLTGITWETSFSTPRTTSTRSQPCSDGRGLHATRQHSERGTRRSRLHPPRLRVAGDAEQQLDRFAGYSLRNRGRRGFLQHRRRGRL